MLEIRLIVNLDLSSMLLIASVNDATIVVAVVVDSGCWVVVIVLVIVMWNGCVMFGVGLIIELWRFGKLNEFEEESFEAEEIENKRNKKGNIVE